MTSASKEDLNLGPLCSADSGLRDDDQDRGAVCFSDLQQIQIKDCDLCVMSSNDVRESSK